MFKILSNIILLILIFIKEFKCQEDSIVFNNSTYTVLPNNIELKIEDNEIIRKEDTDLVMNKKIFRNSIQMGGSIMNIRVPYKGFFKNNELYNLQGKGISFSYLRSFGKNQRWEWGFLLGYEWYRLYFYELNNTSNDTNWNISKYHYAEEFGNFMSTGTYTTNHLHDTMLKYYGGSRWYNIVYVRFGYLLAYSLHINKNFSIKFKMLSSGVSYRNISRINQQLGEGINLYDSGILAFTPFYPIIKIFDDINHDTRNGSIKYSISFLYNICNRQSISFNLFFSNIFNIKYYRYYYYLYYPVSPDPSYSIIPYCNRGLGCAYINPPPYDVISFNIPILINIYRTFQISVSYNFKF
ncbi:MAG: hypothetical protein OHK0036_00230 [Bacteroidia bacterium]